MAVDMSSVTSPELPSSAAKEDGLRLTDAERAELRELTHKNGGSIQIYKRARILLFRDQGWPARAIAESSDICLATVYRICRRYKDGGLKRALHDKPRPGVPKRLTPGQEAQIVALVCSRPPTGYARWTIARLTMEVQTRQIVPRVSRETIRLVLKNHDIKPWRKKNVVRRRARRVVHRADGGRAQSV